MERSRSDLSGENRDVSGGVEFNSRLRSHLKGWASESTRNHFGPAKHWREFEEEKLPTPAVVQQVSVPRQELRNLIEGLDKKICDRFDRLEARLDKLACGVAPGCSAPAAAPATPAPESLISNAPGQPVTTESRLSRVSFTSDLVLSDASGEAVHEGEGLRRQISGESLPSQRYQLRCQWQPGTRLFGTHMQAAEDQWKTLDDYETHSIFEEREVVAKPWYVVLPSSRFRLCWDVMSMLVIGHDMATIPVHLAFYDNDENVVSRALFWPTLLFWTLDIALSFLTGFYKKGQLETSVPMIARQYLMTWFLIDLCIVGTAWAEVIIDVQSEPLGLGRVGKTLRVLRIVRSMRLLRLVKLRRILEDIQDRITSEYVHIMMSVARLSVIIVWTNHFLACGWWAIGASGPREGDPDASESWTSHYLFQSTPLPYQYFTALHWSLTQFTPASMEVAPRNVTERVFAVLVLIFAMIVFSSFVSSITAAMTQLRQLSSTIDKSFVMLRRYLRVRSTPADLTLRIVRCVEHRLGAQKEEIPESSVHLLQYMSQPLQMELLSHVYSPLLTRHPFFRRYGDADPVAMQRVCLAGVQRLSLSTGDALFTEACSGDQMFFVRKGMLRYFPRRQARSAESQEDFESSRDGMVTLGLPTSRSNSGLSRGRTLHPMKELGRSKTLHPMKDFVLEEGDYFCETSLWCPWAHTGTMIAVQMTEVLALEAEALSRVTSCRRLVIRSTQRYGAAYVERLNLQAQEQASDICQLPDTLITDLAAWAFRSRGHSGHTGSVDDMQAFRMPRSNHSSNANLVSTAAEDVQAGADREAADSPHSEVMKL